jgi:hypothetical protein
LFPANRPPSRPESSPGSPSIERDHLLLVGLALFCLLPFSGKPFHVDDTLFVATAKYIVEHPFNPYGFNIVWYGFAMPMAEVTKNPPLASYYGALIGSIAGWSERVWHLGFLLPAVALILGTYRLASHFTQMRSDSARHSSAPPPPSAEPKLSGLATLSVARRSGNARTLLTVAIRSAALGKGSAIAPDIAWRPSLPFRRFAAGNRLRRRHRKAGISPAVEHTPAARLCR